jgi:hypothetical protein
VGLGDDIRALDIDTQMPGADPGSKSDYERAVLGYDAANRRLGAARTLEDPQGLGEQLEMRASQWKARRHSWPVTRARTTHPMLLRSPARPVDHRRRLGSLGRRVTPGPCVRRLRHRHRRQTPAERTDGGRRWPEPPVVDRPCALCGLLRRLLLAVRRGGRWLPRGPARGRDAGRWIRRLRRLRRTGDRRRPRPGPERRRRLRQ